ncbi:ribosomal protection-like ABC-F family protein [Paenibacillus sp. GCM10012307]|uniref:ABC-F family ATP-binding cassette domain-containing protein n=1 Tax=Paenibacillus roseus TaxID=2798579 RepID=A0A934MT69_9BACL|nr:ABC-F family ATP-binding cassette domain-containing protein [Paenibacillus roseus]MBJ6359772.1 ABC-F family ATP-binding cassette domain-containing protein [Paenibacillus roseus]
MTIINVQNLKKYHAANLVLEDVTLQLQAGEKVGLIGRNGSGKSTLLRLISGIDKPDDGMLTIRKDLKIGYLPQIPAEFDQMTAYEVLAYAYRDLTRIKQEMTELEQQMSGSEAASRPELMEQLLRKYTLLQERFEQGGGYDMDAAIDQVAGGLRIDRSYDRRIFGSLSGGEKTRILLASQLVVQPDLLLLDEPTNHLDIKGVEWLEQFIRNCGCACIIVSHDRYFLDATASRIIELEDGEAHLYFTNYSGYAKEKEERLLQQFAQYKEQQKRRKKMMETIRQLEEWGRIGGNEKFFKRAASIRRALDRMEIVKRPVLERKAADFDLSPLERSGRRVITFTGLAKHFGNRVILQEADGSLLYGEKVVLLGDNGSGKTTLFKMLISQLEPDAGQLELGSRTQIGYLAQQESVEHGKLTVLEFFRQEARLEEGEARGILAKYLFYGADVFKPLHMISGGEWTRLRLALLVLSKPNVLFLDEPTNHLDLDSREALEEALAEFPGTILAISHDRYFINRLAHRVWELSKGNITAYLGNYDAYKAKRDERIEWEHVPSGDTMRKPDTRFAVDSPASKAGGKSSNSKQGSKHNLEHLETDIAELEAWLVMADEELHQFDSAADPAQLEAKWREREEQQARLDALLEQWITLTE